MDAKEYGERVRAFRSMLGYALDQATYIARRAADSLDGTDGVVLFHRAAGAISDFARLAPEMQGIHEEASKSLRESGPDHV